MACEWELGPLRQYHAAPAGRARRRALRGQDPGHERAAACAIWWRSPTRSSLARPRPAEQETADVVAAAGGRRRASPRRARPEFAWDDPFRLEEQLTEDERLIQATRARLRAGAADAAHPRGQPPRAGRARASSARWASSACSARPSTATAAPASTTRATAWSRARSSGSIPAYRSMLSVQSSLVMAPIYEFGSRRAARGVPAAPRQGRDRRLLRPDRARPRLRSGLDDDPRAQGAGRLAADAAPRPGSPTRRSPTCSWSGPRTEDDVIRGFLIEKRRGRPERAQDRGQVRAARLADRPDPDGRRVRARGAGAARRRAACKGPFSCLNKARFGIALRRARRRRVLLACGAPVRARPQAVRPPARRQPADPEEARRHADRDRDRRCRRRCGSAA